MSLPACFSKSCPCCFSGGVMHANPLSECSPIMSAAISSHWHNKSNTKAGSLSLVHNIPTRSEVNALKCAGDEGCRRRRRTVALLMRPPVAAAVLRRGACAITGPDGKGSVRFGRAMHLGRDGSGDAAAAKAAWLVSVCFGGNVGEGNPEPAQGRPRDAAKSVEVCAASCQARQHASILPESRRNALPHHLYLTASDLRRRRLVSERLVPPPCRGAGCMSVHQRPPVRPPHRFDVPAAAGCASSYGTPHSAQ